MIGGMLVPLAILKSLICLIPIAILKGGRGNSAIHMGGNHTLWVKHGHKKLQ